ncbi:xanthine dehydrogenase family protein subunit M [Conexibacter stalactiti]|uniref:Xanthine dehydrogenase family protein subunit M n=1 Tax=Conexibacter stalactiti TaxID=1940611 RepID=A0ABU4HX39_9ACTN|nr:xanthine dehydrogenase family protein subunit M [Conexibacter stalactiti]MDW5597887.1 xanthine dehydrogenase family protein subunit M [Conexibacter stalactiti]MEC5038529.1 xanthine dehydrogenase family protein subunit M [Conexibacter stalactiti]
MLLPELEYIRPATVAEAIDALAAERNARVLAGGQTLLNALKLRIVHPAALVDVSRLEELRQVAEEPDGTLRLGAALTYDELAGNALVRERHAVTAAMTSRIVDRQVRARGTLGGNVCLGDPTSNFPPLLVALDARLVVQGPAGTREIAAEQFYLAPYMTALEPGELLTEVLLPPLADGEAVGYESLQVGIDSWALARASALVRVQSRDGNGSGTITAARVALGCGPVPVRQPAMEAALIGGPATRDAIAAAAKLAGEAFDPPADVHATAQYRTAMARVMARRAVISAATTKEA